VEHPCDGWLSAAANPDGGPVLSVAAHTGMGSAIQSVWHVQHVPMEPAGTWDLRESCDLVHP